MSVVGLSSLPIGSVVQVSSEDETIKYLAHLVGVEPEKALITNVPSLKQLGESANYNAIFGESTVFIFRVLGTGIVYGFKSKVISRVESTAHLLISSFPTEIQTRNLRKESRFPCTLAADLHADSTYSGLVTNISAHGCQFCISKQVDRTMIDSLKANSTVVKMDIHFPFNNDATEINVEIKSISDNDSDHIYLGIAFDGEPGGVKLFLESLHLEAITSFIN